ncbi:hypothetical protein HHK36_025189 [Tetracentron sinense]|uniref:NTF2 domain-containing protein n=1 Tax=Tetracentron sinense TaxID=13715 RepID=A0A835D7G1_TETSI|nr:hypothetical protein HHK36_025189 [Tetracentron sinense]
MDPDAVAKAFVEHYYSTFDANRAGLANLYQEASMLTFEGQKIQGSQNIVAKLTSLPFQQCQHSITTVDCQPSGPAGGMLVFVSGNLQLAGEQHALKFSQWILIEDGYVLLERFGCSEGRSTMSNLVGQEEDHLDMPRMFDLERPFYSGGGGGGGSARVAEGTAICHGIWHKIVIDSDAMEIIELLSRITDQIHGEILPVLDVPSDADTTGKLLCVE